MDEFVEVNFDGLVGPTHNYAGLAAGNIASMEHKSRVSSPRRAALEGLEKMWVLREMGVEQGVLPCQMRADLQVLRRLGFVGSDAKVVETAWAQSPELLAAVYSASSMWAANACTVSAAADTPGEKVHMTVANMVSHLHRAIEPAGTYRVLKKVFGDERHFVVHPALPGAMDLGDEGAANHMRLAASHGSPGIEVFVYGRDRGLAGETVQGVRFPGRQTLLASQSVARLHRLPAQQTVFIKQNQEAIDAGVFHNDVIAMSHLDLLVVHERAFAGQGRVIEGLKESYARLDGESGELNVVEVPESVIGLEDAVRSYFFNSQIVETEGGWVMVCPVECRSGPGRDAAEHVMEKAGVITRVEYVSVGQSMFNGGGPGCLRLRVPMSRAARGRVFDGVMLTRGVYEGLKGVIGKKYRESLSPGDLADPGFLRESRDAAESVWGVLGLSVSDVLGG